MPFFTVDDEEGEAYFKRRGTWYAPAAAVFAFDSASPFMQAVRHELVAKGFSVVECTYDGGYDEGFASVDRAFAGEVWYAVNELIEVFSDGPLPTLAIDVYSGQGVSAGEWNQAMRQQAESWSLNEQVRWALDWFAHELASELLGDGYGTGNYSLRGRFRANLQTGNLKDLTGEQE